jgi:hypothetical protein
MRQTVVSGRKNLNRSSIDGTAVITPVTPMGPVALDQVVAITHWVAVPAEIEQMARKEIKARKAKVVMMKINTPLNLVKDDKVVESKMAV